MFSYSKRIAVIAQSDMSRDALNHWLAFKVPKPDQQIDALVARLALEPKKPPKD